jgi:hypothetical protein
MSSVGDLERARRARVGCLGIKAGPVAAHHGDAQMGANLPSIWSPRSHPQPKLSWAALLISLRTIPSFA